MKANGTCIVCGKSKPAAMICPHCGSSQIEAVLEQEKELMRMHGIEDVYDLSDKLSSAGMAAVIAVLDTEIRQMDALDELLVKDEDMDPAALESADPGSEKAFQERLGTLTLEGRDMLMTKLDEIIVLLNTGNRLLDGICGGRLCPELPRITAGSLEQDFQDEEKKRRIMKAVALGDSLTEDEFLCLLLGEPGEQVDRVLARETGECWPMDPDYLEKEPEVAICGYLKQCVRITGELLCRMSLDLAELDGDPDGEDAVLETESAGDDADQEPQAAGEAESGD